MEEPALSMDDEFKNYISSIPLPKRYQPPRKVGVKSPRTTSVFKKCGTDITHILARNLAKHAFDSNGDIKYVFFWKFHPSLEGRTLSTTDIVIQKDLSGNFRVNNQLSDEERIFFNWAYINSIPILGTIALLNTEVVPSVGHMISYILLKNVIILIEPYDTFKKDTTFEDLRYMVHILKTLKIPHPDDPERFLQTDVDFKDFVFYRPGKYFDLQRKDLQYGFGMCPFWAILLLKRASQLDLSKPPKEIGHALTIEYEDLNSAIDDSIKYYELLSEFYGPPITGGRSSRRRRVSHSRKTRKRTT